jgi:hypothetical protein
MRRAWASRWAGLLSHLCGKQAPRFDRASVPGEWGRAVVQAIYVEGFDNLEMNVRHHENQLEGYRQESLRRRRTADEPAVVSVGALPGWQAWMSRRHRGWLSDAWRVQLSGRHTCMLTLVNRLGAWRVCACGLLVDAPDLLADGARESESSSNNSWHRLNDFLKEGFSRTEGWAFANASDDVRMVIRASFRAAPGHREIGHAGASSDIDISVFSYLVPASGRRPSRSQRTSSTLAYDTPQNGA